MDELIQDFQTQLSPAKSGLLYIDEDWGQMDYYDSPPVKFPCALIEVQDADYSDDGDLQQRGVLTVVVKLYLLKLSNTSNKAPQSQKNNAKKGWAICERVNQLLHGQEFLSEGFGVPIRKKMRKVKREDGIYERDIVYTIGFVDNSCVPIRKTTPATPKIRAVTTAIAYQKG